MAEHSDPAPAPTGDDRDTLVEIARLIVAKEPQNGGAPAHARAANDSDAPSGDDSNGDMPSVDDDSVLARLLDILPAGVGLCRDGALLRANTNFALAFGYRSGSELIAQGGLGDILPEIATAGSSAPQHMASARSRSGRTFTIPLSVLPVTPDGDLRLLVLHPRRQDNAGAAISPTGPLFALADALGDGVTLLDERGRIVSLSPSARAAFEASDAAHSRPGATFEPLLQPSDRPAFGAAMERLRKSQAATPVERLAVTLPRKEAVPTQAELMLGRMGADGETAFWAALRVIDTETETPSPPVPVAPPVPELARPEPAPPPPLAAQPPLKADFLAKVSHEVRTPLNSIIGFAELMMQERFGRLPNSKYREYIQDIYESGTYALSLINDLLDISKIEAGKFELNFTAVDVNEVIVETVHVMQPQAKRARVVLRSALAEPVPMVLADRRSLKQILLNLLSNAIKFTPPGGQAIVSSSLETSGDVRIGVRDTGVGMTPSEILQALEPFRQLDTAPREREGTGLGLPLTKALVTANRAQFRIESEARAGTQVDVTFPSNRVVR